MFNGYVQQRVLLVGEIHFGGARGVMVIVVGNGHGDTSSNPGGPCCIMVKVMDCGIVVSEFVLQSRYYVHFQANTLRKGMNSPYPPNYGLNSTITVILEGWLWH